MDFAQRRTPRIRKETLTRLSRRDPIGLRKDIIKVPAAAAPRNETVMQRVLWHQHPGSGYDGNQFGLLLAPSTICVMPRL